MKTDDESLAEAAGQGDRAAFATLVDRHYDRLFRLCWRLTGARDRAEDLAQEVCVKLPRALRTYRGDARFTTWLHRVAINAARDAGRKDATRARAMAAYAVEAPLRVKDGSGDAANEDPADWLQRALRALKPDLAETAALIVGEGLRQAEAAAILGVSAGTVSWRMSEVKRILREMSKAETAAEDAR